MLLGSSEGHHQRFGGSLAMTLADNWRLSTNCALSACADPTTKPCHVTMAYHLVAELLFPVASTLFLIPLTVERGIFSSQEQCHGWTYSPQWRPPNHRTTLGVTELLRATHSFTNVCRSRSLH
ncbi:unnamed protein product, partial [Staurois parvus]